MPVPKAARAVIGPAAALIFATDLFEAAFALISLIGGAAP